jgi:uncharacterized protein involved in response to NO
MQRRNPFYLGNAFIIAGIYLMLAALQYVKVHKSKHTLSKAKELKNWHANELIFCYLLQRKVTHFPCVPF